MAESKASESARGGPPLRAVRVDGGHVLAAVVFALAALVTFREVLEEGLGSSAIVSGTEVLLPVSRGDVVFEAWLTARNAHTILTAPHRIFDTPHCAPQERTLTLGIPMFTMGLLAVPVALFTPNPALAYNFSTALLLILSAVAMYLLVREWTGVAAAGIVAGLLYAFNPIRLGINLTHPSVWDSSWLVFALYFARRLFAEGRWRDAIGLALACALQIGASFYPLLAATLMAPAFAIWLFYQYGLRKVRVPQLLFVLAVVAGVAAVLLGPYLDAREAGEIGGRSEFYFARWSAFLPGGVLFLGWGALGLGLIGLVVPRRLAPWSIAGDPRLALAIGALVTTAIAAGRFNNELLYAVWPTAPFQIPDPYTFLASFVPGLDSIRLVIRLAVAMQVAVCIFAGVGAAWLMKRAAPREIVTSALLVVLAMLSIAPEHFPRETVAVRADPEEIRFFERLEKLGNAGPMLEVPLMTGIARALNAPRRILLTAYHERRISTCFGSFRASGREELAKLVEQLPLPSAAKQLRALGFTTIVVDKGVIVFAHRFARKMRAGAPDRIPLLLEDENFVAYDLGPPRVGDLR